MKTTTPARRLDRRASSVKGTAAVAAFALLGLAGCTGSSSDDAPMDGFPTREVTDGTTTFVVVENPSGGPVLSYAKGGPVELLEVEDGDTTLAFKDMNANGALDTWEDWRLEPADRAQDLASQMSIEQIAGLMLFSQHEGSPQDGLTDDQKQYLSESHLRAVLNAATSDVEATVPWVNAMQAYVETLAAADTPYVPVNFATDPRSTAHTEGYGDSGTISRWPANPGLAATFNTDYATKAGEITAAEYRALGITTQLGPQIDLITEPRWLRDSEPFSEDSTQAAELANAYVSGLQGAEWGQGSVNAMIKHWAGDGPAEGGRESHTDAGKYGVYPGGNLAEHVSVFQGALQSAAIMAAYSVALDGDGNPLVQDRTGTAYDSGRMSMLREDNGYQGVVVTDWGVMTGAKDETSDWPTAAWGAEDLTPAERYVEVLENGVDMFGGVNDGTYLLAASELWQERFEKGELEVDATTRFQESGARILQMSFQVGLYESAFLDPDESATILASADKVAEGYAAQLDSIVMLKNNGESITLAEAENWSDKTVYIPRSYDVGIETSWGPATYVESPTIDLEAAEEYFGTVVTDEVEYDADGKVVAYTAPDLSNVDLVLVGMRSPISGTVGVNSGLDATTGEWYPLSLQYRPYTADGPNVRQVSISGDILPDGTKENRSYFGHTSRVTNEADLDAFERAVAAVDASGRDIPVITAIKASNPVIPAEFEARSDAILVSFGTSDRAVLEVALGLHEPHGRLPMQFPADMGTVEAQFEDVPKDMTPYTDTDGNTYDYGFGLNYAGPITG